MAGVEYLGVRWRDHAPSGASEEEIQAFEARFGYKLPEEYRDFLKAVNGGNPIYKGVSDSSHYQSGKLYLEDFYALNYSDDNYTLELAELNQYNKSEDCYTTPGGVILIGGADSVYMLGLCLRDDAFGKVLYWHPEDIYWESDEELDSDIWSGFLEESSQFDGFNAMLAYTKELANG